MMTMGGGRAGPPVRSASNLLHHGTQNSNLIIYIVMCFKYSCILFGQVFGTLMAVHPTSQACPANV